jgi:Glycosyltransferase
LIARFYVEEEMINPEALFVSSHDESCGIAYFTDQIIADISQIVSCKIIPLDLSLTRSTTRTGRRLADAHIKSICIDIVGAKHCNIQIEWGLFGSTPEDISRRLRWLIAANKNSVVTLHTTNFVQHYPKLMMIAKEIAKFNFTGGYRIARERRNILRTLLAYNSVIKEIKRNNIPIIVHTKRAKKQLSLLFGYENVHAHPLCFPVPTDEVKKRGATLLHTIKSSIGISEESVSVGLFGFVSHYKGHDDAIRAIDILPEDYHLFIFGRQHPQTIRIDGTVEPYIQSLNMLVTDLNLHHRVHFLGEFQEPDFTALISAVDIVWLPYHEVGTRRIGCSRAMRCRCKTSCFFVILCL